MQVMSESQEWSKFLQTITQVEKQREFDRKVDRLKKSSSATTIWAVLPGIFGIYGIAHFYLNRPIEGLVILLAGMVPTFFLMGSLSWILAPYFYGIDTSLGLNSSTLAMVWVIAWGIRISFFVGNIISARYHYSRYDFYIHLKAQKPWNNWGLDSKMSLF